MTPKEKAIELVDKYISFNKNKIAFVYTKESSKQCAIIAANEALNADWFISEKEDFIKWGLYWEEVKKEITKL